MWSHVICDLSTGVKQLPVFPADGSWRTGLNGAIGSGSHSFKLRDSKTRLPAGTWRGLVAPWSRVLVVCWGGVPQYAGLISGHDWDRDSGTLQVRHQELRALLSRRLVTGTGSYSAGGFFEVAGKSLRGVGRAIVARATAGTPGDGHYVPVVFPADEAGGVTRRWWFYELANAEDMLTEIQDTDGGPDVYLRPRWSTAGTLEWVLEIGSPNVSGPTVEWAVDAPKSPAVGVSQATSADKTLTGVIGIGKGSEQDLLLGFAGGLGTFPIRLDGTRQYKTLDTPAALDAAAMGELRTVEHPTVQIGVKSAPAKVALPDVRVGSTLRLRVSGDEFMADGTAVTKVIGVSGSVGSSMIGLETQ